MSLLPKSTVRRTVLSLSAVTGLVLGADKLVGLFFREPTMELSHDHLAHLRCSGLVGATERSRAMPGLGRPTAIRLCPAAQPGDKDLRLELSVRVTGLQSPGLGDFVAATQGGMALVVLPPEVTGPGEVMLRVAGAGAAPAPGPAVSAAAGTPAGAASGQPSSAVPGGRPATAQPPTTQPPAARPAGSSPPSDSSWLAFRWTSPLGVVVSAPRATSLELRDWVIYYATTHEWDSQSVQVNYHRWTIAWVALFIIACIAAVAVIFFPEEKDEPAMDGRDCARAIIAGLKPAGKEGRLMREILRAVIIDGGRVADVLGDAAKRSGFAAARQAWIVGAQRYAHRHQAVIEHLGEFKIASPPPYGAADPVSGP